MTRVPQATSCWTEGQWVTDLVTVTPQHSRDSLRVTGFLISSLMARLLAEVRRPASSFLPLPSAGSGGAYTAPWDHAMVVRLCADSRRVCTCGLRGL